METPKFRQDFPEFSNPMAFPDALVGFWGGLAELEVSQCRFGPARPYAVELLAAHYIATAKGNQKGAGSGTPGLNSGIATSKTVGSVSVSYDQSTVSGVQGSLYAGTRYGTQYASMARRYGAGAVQL